MRTRRLLGSLAVATAVLSAAIVSGAQGAAPGAQRPVAAVMASSGATGVTGATTTPALTASLSACHADPVAANRYAIFASQTVSAAVPDTLVMAVDFQLEERSAGSGAFLPVKATGFNSWVASQPRVGIFTYNHEVTALPAPAAFRVLVRARWIGRHHKVLHETSALSPVCVQPAIAPDLIVGRISRSPGAAAGTVQYSVEVHNVGTAAAGPFQVSLTVGATALAPVSISGLAAGASAPATFTGPACGAGTTLTASADSSGSIAEPANPRRTRTLGCPIGG